MGRNRLTNFVAVALAYAAIASLVAASWLVPYGAFIVLRSLVRMALA